MAGKEVRARKLWTKRLFWSMAGREDPTTSSLAGYAWKWILSALVSGFIASPIGHAARRVEIVERDALLVAVFNCKAIAGFISARNSFRGFRCYRHLLFALVSSIFRRRSKPKSGEVSARPSEILTRRRCSFTCPNWPSHLPIETRHKEVSHLPGFLFCEFAWKQSPFRDVSVIRVSPLALIRESTYRYIFAAYLAFFLGTNLRGMPKISVGNSRAVLLDL